MLKKNVVLGINIAMYICTHKSIKSLSNFSFYNINHNNIVSIYSLNLKNNKITFIPNNAFIKLTVLIQIYLSNNEITIINSTMFNNNNKLMSIYLSRNKIHTFNLNLNALQNLNILYIDNNHLKFLNENIFKKFIIKATYLYIQNNKFTCFCNMYWIANIAKYIISSITTENDFCSSSKLKTTSLKCFIKHKSGSGNCNNMIFPTCIYC